MAGNREIRGEIGGDERGGGLRHPPSPRGTRDTVACGLRSSGIAACVFDALPRYDRAVAFVSLVGVVVMAWIYLLHDAGIEMGGMGMSGGQMMRTAPAWTPGYAVLIFFMWAIMMVAMMLPSAARPILRVVSFARTRSDQAIGIPAAMLFTAGYLVVWTGFSFAATLLQWASDRAGILSEAMSSRSAVVAGLLLLAAGVYQLTPWKQDCLRHCRFPLESPAHGGEGAPAIVATGMRHGLFCLGCCWVLMGLLFVGGVMNVLWIAVLALLVFVEQALPWGGGVSRWAGAALIVWGSVALTTAIL
jgi:predicted metal-binding membrane protein